MENTLNTFKAQQELAIGLLRKLQHVLDLGMAAGVSIDPALDAKLKGAIANVTGEKLKVALIGGFSEGKTSIAAAWMEKLDKSTMRISHQESSNAVKIYEADDDFVLIDTPGLFGFKEQANAETHAIEKYKEITRKYVSEAHLVLYVMNPTNPLKESHREELTWLFRTLDLLPRTVFVLSRFDEVADVEDEDDYQTNLLVKRNNVTGRLNDLIGLNDNEMTGLSIVAVAANPFDLGVEHWLTDIARFKSLSHIASLQAATAQKIQQNGGSAAVANDMRSSVIRDVLDKELPVATENENRITRELDKIDQLSARLREQLASTEHSIEAARIRLREFAARYFSDLILQARGCDSKTFGDFFEREIGAEGIIVATRMQNEFSRQTNSIALDVEKMQVSFDSEVSHFNSTVTALGKQGINYVLKGNYINNTTVLAARDGIATAAKTVGMDIGKHLKFKPWGAVKFAKGAAASLAVLGLALEAWDSWQEYQREEAFAEGIRAMTESFEKQRQDFLDLINSNNFKQQFFGTYLDLDRQLRDLEEKQQESRASQQRFREWRRTAEAIDAEFFVLKQARTLS
ncbi:LeoA/HP0731 family dynamin-like GTPase [Stenotrophomonas sp.]|uniref:LeoA/HP0731 family dynamin-like GTPase n=1 Tax=Stenotrophomonas sp. TaxID=69392 RepID=UPI0028B25657|nr:LeoA/HP0731 family dynamin-like GTPase [Stenotrophomonas sp.]